MMCRMVWNFRTLFNIFCTTRWYDFRDLGTVFVVEFGFYHLARNRFFELSTKSSYTFEPRHPDKLLPIPTDYEIAPPVHDRENSVKRPYVGEGRPVRGKKKRRAQKTEWRCARSRFKCKYFQYMYEPYVVKKKKKRRK